MSEFQFPQVDFTEYIAICHAENCINANLPIQINAPTKDVIFFCGGCGGEIVDHGKLAAE